MAFLSGLQALTYEYRDICAGREPSCLGHIAKEEVLLGLTWMQLGRLWSISDQPDAHECLHQGAD